MGNWHWLTLSRCDQFLHEVAFTLFYTRRFLIKFKYHACNLNLTEIHTCNLDFTEIHTCNLNLTEFHTCKVYTLFSSKFVPVNRKNLDSITNPLVLAHPTLKCGGMLLAATCSTWSIATSKYHFEYKAEFRTWPTKRLGLALKLVKSNKIRNQHFLYF